MLGIGFLFTIPYQDYESAMSNESTLVDADPAFPANTITVGKGSLFHAGFCSVLLGIPQLLEIYSASLVN
jgi:hypothetical protein